MVKLLVNYMEMLEPPQGPRMMPSGSGVTIAQEWPGLEDYLSLYRAVGAPLQWDQNLRLPRTELDAFLNSPSTSIFILRDQGLGLGLCEFDRSDPANVELTHFGLIPSAQGKRLGPLLLDAALRAIWSEPPRRVWLHTDTNDHEKAQATYHRAGFRSYAEIMEEFPD
jgi:ribosomal protein S18 acetylase RimI-like enzyme